MSAQQRLAAARSSLAGLAIGDCFGERFFVNPAVAQTMVEQRATAAPPWPYTDDTDMAIAIVTVLEKCGAIDQDELALEFGRRYRRGRNRGYGGGAMEILEKINLGIPWREAAGEAFGGMGSMGNGAAMRVAPLGAYYSDDHRALVEQAMRSAELTHAHPDAQAGAVAVALAAAYMSQSAPTAFDSSDFFAFIQAHTPAGATRDGIERAAQWPLTATPSAAARQLGSGQKVLSSDTVPFALWCMARHPDHFAEALWTTVAGFGDRDTTCAMVGGCVCLRAAEATIPREWMAAAEPARP